MKHSEKLEVKGICKRFVVRGRDLEVLSNINLSVRSGRFVSLVGASGCGKTTLLKIIDGLVPPSSGEIVLDGRRIVKPGTDRGFVFQIDSLFPWRRVIDNVSFGMQIQGNDKKETHSRALESINLVGLKGFERYYPAELSGGMRQRVNLARALVVDPEVLLMDEPFASLDEQTRILLGDKVLQIHQRMNQTTLLITHNITEAVQLSDRVIVMTYRPGRIKRIVDIDLPRPRSSEIVGSPRFGELVGTIWNDLREEASRGLVEGEKEALPLHHKS